MTKAIISVNTKTANSNVKLALSTKPDLANPIYSQVVNTGSLKLVKIEVDGLLENTQYYYGVVINEVLQPNGRGMFKTAKTGPHSYTCAFASCARTGSTHEVFSVIRDLNPDFFIHMGDLHYSDIVTNEPALYRTAYDNVFASGVQSKLYAEIPTPYIWDDHDYGANNSDGNSPSKEAACTTYREIVPHYDLPYPTGKNPVFQSFVRGRVRFIVTDLRAEKTPRSTADSAAKTMMSEQQTQWFFNELLKPEPLKIWVCTKPYIETPTTGSDAWGGYSFERKRIANFIKERNLAGRVAILAGDMHALAIDDGTNSDYADGGGAPIPVFQAAQMDQAVSPKGGPYTSGIFTNVNSGQYGVMNVIDDGGSSIRIEWIGKRLTEVLTTHTFNVPASAYTTSDPINTSVSEVTNLTSSNILTTSVNLNWVDSASVTKTYYLIYKDGVHVDTIQNNNYLIGNLQPNTTYNITIKTKNVFGVISTGASLQVTTEQESELDEIPTQDLILRVDTSNNDSLTFYTGSNQTSYPVIKEFGDLSGNNNNLIPYGTSSTNGASYVTDLYTKPVGEILVQANAFQKTPLNNTFSGNATVILVMDIPFPSDNTSQRLWDIDNGTTNVIGLQKRSSNVLTFYVDATAKTPEYPVQELSVAINVWTTVITPNTVKLYKNKNLVMDVASVTNVVGDLNFRLGRTISNGQFGKLRIGEAIIYNNTLSALDLDNTIMTLMNKWNIS